MGEEHQDHLKPGCPTASRHTSGFSNGATGFLGFHPLQSNTTYTPNQLFDVVMPNSSQSCFRLVAYMLRKSLGWCDEFGNPVCEQIKHSYRQLEKKSGVSSTRLKGAIDEAIEKQFIRCIVRPNKESKGRSAVIGEYELKWDRHRNPYTRDIEHFNGFHTGEGNRTDIPNQFFDDIVKNENQSVFKTVGSIIRWSIGFQAERGVRRQTARLSFSQIQRYANIKSSSTLSRAIRYSIERGYIVQKHKGVFDPQAGLKSDSSCYALRWRDGYGSKTEGTPEIEAGHSRDRSGSTPGIEVEKHTRNRSDIETTNKNKTLKQQDAVAGDLVKELGRFGLGGEVAKKLVSDHPVETIRKQIEWLPLRNPSRNRAGMLRSAITNNWSAPVAEANEEESPEAGLVTGFYAGFAGNTGNPVSPPAGKDLQLAGAFLGEVARIDSAEVENPEKIGRLLGRDASSSGLRTPSFSLALRSAGERFLAQMAHRAGERTKHARKRENERLTAVRERYEPQYHDFLRSEEERLKREEATALDSFYKLQEQKKKDAEKKGNKINSAFFLRHLNKEETRLQAMREYFHLPGFEAWYEKHPKQEEETLTT